MMPWRKVLWLACYYEARQHAKAVAGGIGGLLMLALFALLAFTLEGR